MGEISRIVDQFQRAYKGEAWHGPAVMEALRDVTAEQALKKPIKDAHSIWEIVLHINAWHNATTQRLQGYVVELSHEEDWPAVKSNDESDWEATKGFLNESFENLLKKISSLSDSDLEKTVPGKSHSIYFLLHGVIQHDLYHAGQLVLLKK